MTYQENLTVAIVGAGPAGLAAACALSHEGVGFTVFETGKHLTFRHHDSAADLATGVGGVGLFSDGKFSYYPSGTYLYKLSNLVALQKAYNWISQQLQTCGIGVEPFPKQLTLASNGSRRLGDKRYQSHSSSLEQRKALIARLQRAIDGEIIPSATIRSIRRDGDGYVIEKQIDNQRFDALILATGRLGGIDLHEGKLKLKIPMKEIRYEFGIRIESHHSVGFLPKVRELDAKRLWENELAEFRTFCTCRRGEIWNIPYNNLSAISGRGDGPLSDYSNFGVLTRFADSNLQNGSHFWHHLLNSALKRRQAIWEPIESFIKDLDPKLYDNDIDLPSRPWFPSETFRQGKIREALGTPLYSVIKSGLQDLLDWCPDLLDSRTVCLFPAVEGTGFYPNVDNELKVKGHNIWCAGDLVGRFRGLTPALISGYYAGLNAKAVLSSQ